MTDPAPIQQQQPQSQDQSEAAVGGLESFHSTEDLKFNSSTATLYCLDVHLKVVIDKWNVKLKTVFVPQAGHDLSIKDSCGTSDPYVKFFHDGKMVHKSKTVYKDLNPFWDEKFELIIEDTSVPLDLKVNSILPRKLTA